jgi:hypothetical protein
LKKFNGAAEAIQLEHKRAAVTRELTAVERRVLAELKQAKVSAAAKIASRATMAAMAHEKYTEPPDKPMIVIYPDGTVRSGYGFRPVGPKIVTQAEFENLINALRSRSSTELLNLGLPATEIVRRYFVEFQTPCCE